MAKISPDGKYIAYLGYEDRVQAYQNKQLWIMDTTGNNHQLLSGAIDASISQLEWSSNSSGLYISYDQQGDTKIAFLDLKGSVEQLAAHLGGTSMDVLMEAGLFLVSEKGEIAYTFSTPYAPAELAFVKNKSIKSITKLNAALLGNLQLGTVKEIRYTSTFDGINIQGWVVFPPNYDSAKKYSFWLKITEGLSQTTVLDFQ